VSGTFSDDRRAFVRALRDAIRAALPEGYAEGTQYGGIGFFVPHSRYPHGYHCDPQQPLPFAGVVAQKHHVSLTLMAIYFDADAKQAFADAWVASGCKLDMGQGCVRIKPAQFATAPLAAVAQVIAAAPVDWYLARYEAALPAAVRRRRGLPG
jgi:hypothetical protein